MQIGETYRVKPMFTIATKDGQPSTMVGKIVWIHPKERFARLEFEAKAGKVYETFWPEQLTQSNLILQKKGR